MPAFGSRFFRSGYKKYHHHLSCRPLQKFTYLRHCFNLELKASFCGPCSAVQSYVYNILTSASEISTHDIHADIKYFHVTLFIYHFVPHRFRNNIFQLGSSASFQRILALPRAFSFIRNISLHIFHRISNHDCAGSLFAKGSPT